MNNEERNQRIHEFDQESEFMIDNIPRAWFRLYTKLQEEGFTKEEAFILLQQHMSLSR